MTKISSVLCALLAGLPTAPAEPPAKARTAPPKIVIKADDLRTNANGALHPAWPRFLELIQKHKAKASIGIICNSLETDAPRYFQWIKEAQTGGAIEFWFHGYDHQVYTGPDGKQHSEFGGGRSYDEQKWRYERSIALAKEKLGISLHTFGPPGGGIPDGQTDPATVALMQEIPEMKVWLYQKPIDEPGKTLASQGKVAILDRVWPVNIEQPLFVPNADKFVAGLARYPAREYFVIQGHPTHWKDAGFTEFEKILVFLTDRQAVFMTPLECAEAMRRSKMAGTAAR